MSNYRKGIAYIFLVLAFLTAAEGGNSGSIFFRSVYCVSDDEWATERYLVLSRPMLAFLGGLRAVSLCVIAVVML